MLTEYQDILRGISIGIGFSLLVTYWPLIKVKVRRGVKWTWLFLQIAWKSRPGHRRLTLSSRMKLLPGVQSREFHTVPFDTSTVRFENISNAMVRIGVKRSGVISISRVPGSNEDVACVEFELWGCAPFWASIKRAWKSDIVDLREWVAGWKDNVTDEKHQ